LPNLRFYAFTIDALINFDPFKHFLKAIKKAEKKRGNTIAYNLGLLKIVLLKKQ